jgi:hypothetical protein
MENKKLNTILIRRKGLVLVPDATTPFPTGADAVVHRDRMKTLLATFNRNLQDIGYTLSAKLIKALCLADERYALNTMKSILEIVKELGGVKHYYPMYPNFPEQVIQMEEAELYLNAVFHYFSDWLADISGDRDYIWMPRYHKDHREPLHEKVKLRVLDLGTEDYVNTLATQLATANTSLSPTDKADLAVLIADFRKLPEGIPNKENLAFVASVLFQRVEDLTPYFKTATDVLRLATALSEGDVSLAAPSKFRKFKRVERRRLLDLIDHCGNLQEDMLRFEGRWVKLSERLHPGDYWDKYQKAFSAIQAIRNGHTDQTFRSKVEEAVRGGKVKAAVELLGDRPGEFGRRLDHLVRKARTKDAKVAAIQGFLDVASVASTPVLLQMMAHFDHRQDGTDRTIFPKGNVAKVMSIDPLPEMDGELSKLVSRGIRRVLRKRFSELPELGNVYLDPALKDYLLPFSQRSASKALRTLVRGSHIPFGFSDKNTIRLFIWWKEPKGGLQGEWSDRVDLDLSAVAYADGWRNLGAVAYYDLRNDYARHSGDITSAPKGASEFIDIDINKALAAGVRYIVMSVNSYTEQNLCDLPECYAGWMLREKPQSGEVYDPRTLEDKVDLAMQATAGIPLIADLVERKLIWCDAAMSVNRYRWNNVESNKGTIELLGKALENVTKPSIYDLLYLHAKARGTLVEDRKKADVEFSVAKGTQYDLERLASEFMADAPKAMPKAHTAAA